jgi:hypothetical protein
MVILPSVLLEKVMATGVVAGFVALGYWSVLLINEPYLGTTPYPGGPCGPVGPGHEPMSALHRRTSIESDELIIYLYFIIFTLIMPLFIY